MTIDGVQFRREYHNDSVLDEGQLTDVVGVVGAATCGRQSDARIESTYLAVGTELRAIDGHDPSSRFAAATSDAVVVYGRRQPGGPVDALDDVEHIMVVSQQDGRTELGRIVDADTVSALVSELDPSTIGAVNMLSWDEQHPVLIELVHSDGLSTQVLYDLTTNRFLNGTRPSAAWPLQVSAALERSGDGVVDGSSIQRPNGDRVPLRLMGSCFADEAHAAVDRNEVLEIDDPRAVLDVYAEFYDASGTYLDLAVLAGTGSRSTEPADTFSFASSALDAERAIIRVAFANEQGGPSNNIELCATLDLNPP